MAIPMPDRDYAAFVFLLIDVPGSEHNGQVIMVKKRKFEQEPLPKFPGGRKDEIDESVEDTVAREILEELGITLIKEDIKHVTTHPKWNHDVVFCGSVVHSLDGLKLDTGEGENVMFYTPDELGDEKVALVPGHEHLLYALQIRY